MSIEQKLVTVIIPCFNYAGYVEEAINSVYAQTHKNLEVIVINDGSTDNSDKILQKLHTKYEFTYVNRENRGIISTRNEGAKLAKGDYIVQLDADDWLDPLYVETALTAASEHKVDIVYSQASVFGRASFVTNFPDFNIEYLKHDGYINVSALADRKIFKNRLYDAYLDDKGNEDWDFFLDACLDGYTAFLVDKPLLHYRKHPSKMSRADLFEGTFNELLVRYHILSKQNAKHPEEMGYFSPYISFLLDSIKRYEQLSAADQEVASMKKEIVNIHASWSYRLVSKLIGVKRRLKRIFA